MNSPPTIDPDYSPAQREEILCIDYLLGELRALRDRGIVTPESVSVVEAEKASRRAEIERLGMTAGALRASRALMGSRPREALALAEEARALAPDQVDTWALSAEISSLLGEFERAIALCREAVDVHGHVALEAKIAAYAAEGERRARAAALADGAARARAAIVPGGSRFGARRRSGGARACPPACRGPGDLDPQPLRARPSGRGRGRLRRPSPGPTRRGGRLGRADSRPALPPGGRGPSRAGAAPEVSVAGRTRLRGRCTPARQACRPAASDPDADADAVAEVVGDRGGVPRGPLAEADPQPGRPVDRGQLDGRRGARPGRPALDGGGEVPAGDGLHAHVRRVRALALAVGGRTRREDHEAHDLDRAPPEFRPRGRAAGPRPGVVVGHGRAGDRLGGDDGPGLDGLPGAGVVRRQGDARGPDRPGDGQCAHAPVDRLPPRLRGDARGLGRLRGLGRVAGFPARPGPAAGGGRPRTMRRTSRSA